MTASTGTAWTGVGSKDASFGASFIDVDEWRDEPVRHRYVHGGFEDGDTRLSFYFPPRADRLPRSGRYAEAYISDLSTGTRRIVELAGLLALDARLLCLDEPTAGLAQRETKAAGPLIQEISRELHASVLVIEHDMPLIMGISDRVYRLDLGRVIAKGTPNGVRSNPAVIASYLGTDERPIERRGPRPSGREPRYDSTVTRARARFGTRP